MAKPVAFAVAAHPDDIEFMMAGTLLLLGEAGYELHVMNLASGHCASVTEDKAAISARRLEEARDSAALMNAVLHAPITDDLEILYARDQLRRLAAVMRAVAPDILLTHAPSDYMEDHMNASRLAVTAAFARGMPNFETDPASPHIEKPVTVYHALPHGLRDGLRRRVLPGQYVDVTAVMDRKRACLACHRSQKEWLDRTQGLDSYLNAMSAMCREAGRWSGRFEYAEGWRRRLHLGFCGEQDDPLGTALGNRVLVSEVYEEDLDAGL
jgi:N-acetylglucosamine malate deacetylase 1